MEAYRIDGNADLSDGHQPRAAADCDRPMFQEETKPVAWRTFQGNSMQMSLIEMRSWLSWKNVNSLPIFANWFSSQIWLSSSSQKKAGRLVRLFPIVCKWVSLKFIWTRGRGWQATPVSYFSLITLHGQLRPTWQRCDLKTSFAYFNVRNFHFQNAGTSWWSHSFSNFIKRFAHRWNSIFCQRCHVTSKRLRRVISF